jgi:hypothetical protein
MPIDERDPALLPGCRLSELARLLARGLLRLRDRPPRAAEDVPQAGLEKFLESPRGGLELSPETRLSVHDG